MAGTSAGLSPDQVVVVDDHTEYGIQLQEAVTRVLGEGRGARRDRCALTSHQHAIRSSDDYWSSCVVALVDARDSGWRSDERTPVAVGEVVRRLKRLDLPPRVVVYSANFDTSVFLRYVVDVAPEHAYYDAGVLLRDAEHLRSALLEVDPSGQVPIPRAEHTGQLGRDADLVGAITSLRGRPETWRWALGRQTWPDLSKYGKIKARKIATEDLRMAPAIRPSKNRNGMPLQDRNPDGPDITSVVRAILGFRRGGGG